MDSTQKGGQQARRAAMLCQNPRFALYLDQRRRRFHKMAYGALPDGTHTQEDCRDWLCAACGIKSRAELDHNEKARAMLDRVMADYSKWERDNRALERIVGGGV